MKDRQGFDSDCLFSLYGRILEDNKFTRQVRVASAKQRAEGAMEMFLMQRASAEIPWGDSRLRTVLDNEFLYGKRKGRIWAFPLANGALLNINELPESLGNIRVRRTVRARGKSYETWELGILIWRRPSTERCKCLIFRTEGETRIRKIKYTASKNVEGLWGPQYPFWG